MKKPLTVALTALVLISAYSAAPLALAPLTLTPKAEAARASHPVTLAIPSIALGSPLIPMGLTKDGELDVPSGTTNDVGWYAKGVVPGERGAAVLDAHVFAAFSNLHQVARGDDIFVTMDDGSTRRFRVTRAKMYELSELSSQELFMRSGGRYLHLITCAGEKTADGSTYTHRLVVYATLAD